jgi:hypothetical protein
MLGNVEGIYAGDRHIGMKPDWDEYNLVKL